MQVNQTSVSEPLIKKRLLSIDALRGFDMFWILGAEQLFAVLFIITGLSIFDAAAAQMLHSQWHGFTAYDLIFPLFIFLSGVSLGIAAKPFSELGDNKRKQLLRHGIKRLLLLLLLGIIYNHGWGSGIPISAENIRYVSVLGRIGLSWFVAALLVWYISERMQWLVAILILIFYWVLLQYVSLGGFGGGDFSANGALNVWFDQTLLPGTTYRELAIDPEGLLSNIPSVVNALFGVFVGRYMIRHLANSRQLLVRLTSAALLLLVLGYSWGVFFPINKTLWTSSFVLVTSGYSILLLSLFYLIVDVFNFKRLAIFFAVIGTNSIIVYVGSSLINWQYSANSLFGGLSQAMPAGWQELIIIVGILAIQWVILYEMYRRRIFVKV
jgi:predicted acyltransferase